MLKRILSAYVCLRPDIGYIQGMCFIAAILLLNMEEIETFICLVNLMESPCLNAFYTVNQHLVSIILRSQEFSILKSCKLI